MSDLMFPGGPIVQIDALFDESGVEPNMAADPRPTLAVVDIVTGIDRMRQCEFLVYGRDALKRIIETGKTEALEVMRVELDQETDDLERLCALMMVVKGRCDYMSTEDMIKQSRRRRRSRRRPGHRRRR
jgi:hypothetical protein